MPNYLIDFFATFPVELLFAYAATRLLTMRSNALYIVVYMAVVVPFIFLRSSMPDEVYVVLSLALTLFNYFVWPLAFSRGNLWHRLLILVLAVVVLFTAEIFGMGFAFLMGLNVVDYSAIRAMPAAFVLMHVVHLAFLALGLMCVHVLARRIEKEKVAASLPPFMGFLVVQVVLLTLCMAISQFVIRGLAQFVVDLSVLSVVLVVMDVLLYWEFDRYNKKRREEQRLDMLQKQVGVYLDEYRATFEGIEQVSKMRHDLRNQLQVVALLNEQGNYDEARGHLETLRRRFDVGGAQKTVRPLTCASHEGGVV